MLAKEAQELLDYDVPLHTSATRIPRGTRNPLPEEHAATIDNIRLYPVESTSFVLTDEHSLNPPASDDHMTTTYGGGELRVFYCKSHQEMHGAQPVTHGKPAMLTARSATDLLSSLNLAIARRPAVIDEFAMGSEPPANQVVQEAHRLYRLAHERTRQPEISVDIDGALSFDLRLHDDTLVMAEMEVDGTVNAGIYNPDDRQIYRIRSGGASDLIRVITG